MGSAAVDPNPRAQAERDWQALAERCVKSGRGGEFLVREGLARAAAVWPTSQVISAAVARAIVDCDSEAASSSFEDVVRLDGGLRRYQQDDHYTESRNGLARSRPVYYDDNAWIALNLIEVALLSLRGILPADAEGNISRARGILRLLQSGQDSRDGGVLWRVNGDTRNTCSTAPAGLVALRIIEAERLGNMPAADHSELISFAQRCATFLGDLRDSRGLIADHKRADGRIEPSIYSYNQGTSLGLNVQLHRIADDPAALGRAEDIAAASVNYYAAEDRLWHESPAFVAIYLRHLATFRAETGLDTGAGLCRNWLIHLSQKARNPDTGFYTEGGIGSYDGSVSLDQAGITAARFAALWPTELVPLLC